METVHEEPNVIRWALFSQPLQKRRRTGDHGRDGPTSGVAEDGSVRSGSLGASGDSSSRRTALPKWAGRDCFLDEQGWGRWKTFSSQARLKSSASSIADGAVSAGAAPPTTGVRSSHHQQRRHPKARPPERDRSKSTLEKGALQRAYSGWLGFWCLTLCVRPTLPSFVLCS